MFENDELAKQFEGHYDNQDNDFIDPDVKDSKYQEKLYKQFVNEKNGPDDEILDDQDINF